MTQPADSDAPTLTFELPGGGHALFTSRAHGNLSSTDGLGCEQGALARERLRERLGLRRLLRGHQVHGVTIVPVREQLDLPPVANKAAPVPYQADGHATGLLGVGALALTADCLPVALGGEGAVAMVHAGWRGLAAGVLEQGVRALREVGCEGELVAILGPGAGPCCYEVGPEVHAAFPGAPRRGRYIDLKAIARSRLRAAGVESVRDVGLCTICDSRFYSHRREAQRAGRQAGIAWLAQAER